MLLGRGASTEKVEEWLRAASPVEGFIGFAIGRSIWWDALKGFLAEELDRRPPRPIADNYLHFVERLQARAGRLKFNMFAGARGVARPAVCTNW